LPPTRYEENLSVRERGAVLPVPELPIYVRLLVHDCTWGGGATKEETEAGGQTGPHR